MRQPFAGAEERQLIGMPEAAQIADVTAQTVRNWISAGRLAGFRVGPRLIKVYRQDVEALVSSGSIPSAGDHNAA